MPCGMVTARDLPWRKVSMVGRMNCAVDDRVIWTKGRNSGTGGAGHGFPRQEFDCGYSAGRAEEPDGG